jgi:excisionase family DNA binding protein
MSLQENGATVKGLPPEQADRVVDMIDGLRDEVRQLRDEVRSLRRDPDQLLTTADVADLLQISERTVDAIRADGALPSFKFRGNRRYVRENVLAYVRRMAEGGN